MFVHFIANFCSGNKEPGSRYNPSASPAARDDHPMDLEPQSPAGDEPPGPGGEAILVTGASGFLGRQALWAAARSGPARGTFWSAAPGSLRGLGPLFRLDLASREGVRRLFEELRPAAVIHAAACADWRRCEEDPELARRANVQGTRHIAEAAARVGSRLVYVSTDLVFDGEEAPYDETASPRPLSAYGRTKLEGERVALESSEDSCVVRLSLLFGWSRGARANFSEAAIHAIRSGGEVAGFVDEFRTPLYAPDAAEALVALARRPDLTGVFHLGGGERLSRYEFALRACRAFSLPESRVRPAKVAEVFPGARRARDSSLDDRATRRALGTLPRPIDEALRAMRLEEPGT